MRYRKVFRLGSLVGILGLVCGARLLMADKNSAAQDSSPTPGRNLLVLRKNVRRVMVDVVVRNAKNEPVGGLTAKDFVVSEDGQPQRVLSFEVHDFEAPSISLPVNSALPPNIFVNVPATPERGPLNVLLFDMVNTDDLADQIYARKQALDFVRRMPAGTRFAVYVHSDGLHLAEGFTDDKDALYRTLDPENPKSHFPRAFLMSRNFGRGDPVAMISVMTHIAEFLNGIPGRKNLIWMSGTFPMDLYAHAGDPLDLREDIRGMVDELTRAQVAVYPVNVRGVVVNPEGALTGGGSPKSGVGGEAGGSGISMGGVASGGSAGRGIGAAGIQDGVGPLEGNGADSLIEDYQTQNDIATATGGRAFYSDNDLTAALGEAVQDGASYYTLSYSPTNPNYDGSLRRIRITLARQGCRLAYRRSYYADDPEVPRARPRKNASPEEMEEDFATREQERLIFANLQHGAPLVHDLIFKVRIHAEGPPAMATPEQMAQLASQPAHTRGKKSVSLKSLKPVPVQRYDIYYVIVASQIKPQSGKPLPLEFAAAAYDADGWVANGIFEKAAEDDWSNPFAGVQPAPPESWQPSNQKVYRALQILLVPTSATSMRVVVRDTSTDRIGALEVALPLPPEPVTGAATAGPSERPKLN